MRKAICLLLFILVLCFAVMANADEPQKVSVGDIITFGTYEQDNLTIFGPEPIEWIVLDVQDGKALLLSRYGLYPKPYNTDWVYVTWEDCTLRTWLNDDFLNEAFNPEEQSSILITEVDNSDAQGFDWTTVEGDGTTGGNNTEDRIFLLSCAEADRYLGVKCHNIDAGDNVQSRVAPTKYAISNRAFADYGDEDRAACKTSDGKRAGWWWLRSPGDYQANAAVVSQFGSFTTKYADNEFICVRPALWVNLELEIF